ncbi:MAG TPA: DNRLRE domain-containing protein [Tepidisphaeraceae bacterium]|jgi:hypothetical protein|nr:DNRLRE domain-containing protein [Tepidisphaeraceae bacterium]
MQLKSTLAFTAALATVLGLAPLASADTITFRNGLNEYAGTVDTTIFGSQPTNNNNTSANGFFGVQTTSGVTGQNQFLIRFDDLFGPGANQIPAGSTINSATLGFTRGPNGGFTNAAQLYDLTSAFNATTVTFNNAGSTANDGIIVGTDTDATQTNANFTISSGQDAAFGTVNVSTSLAEWAANPTANLGWMLHAPTATGNVNVRSANATDFADRRPTLTVDFTPAPVPEPASVGLIAAGLGAALLRRRRA